MGRKTGISGYTNNILIIGLYDFVVDSVGRYACDIHGLPDILIIY